MEKILLLVELIILGLGVLFLKVGLPFLRKKFGVKRDKYPDTDKHEE